MAEMRHWMGIARSCERRVDKTPVPNDLGGGLPGYGMVEQGVQQGYSMTRRFICAFAFVIAGLSSPTSSQAQPAPAAPACTAPAEFTRLGHALTRLARRLAMAE